jgi:hypothetical protein
VEITDGEFSGSGELSDLVCDPEQPATLDPDEVLECTATYVVTQIDVEAGVVENTAQVVGLAPAGHDVSAHGEEALICVV